MTWEPVDPEDQKYLEIGDQLVMTRDPWFGERMDFWDNIIVDKKWTTDPIKDILLLNKLRNFPLVVELLTIVAMLSFPDKLEFVRLIKKSGPWNSTMIIAF